jgi:outer membrane protein assembly factor BamB
MGAVKFLALTWTLLLWTLPSTGGTAQDAPAAARPAPAPGDWPMFRRDAAQTGVAAGTLGESFELLWTFECGGAVTSSPVVVDGKVYFGSDDQKIRCVRLSDGEGVWAHETEDMIEAPPIVHGGAVYCGSSDFFMYALDAATGERLWRYETDDKILGGAAAVPGPDGRTHIVFGSYDTHLYCLDSERGELVWRYPTANYVNGTPAIWQNKAIFGGCDAVLHVVDLEKGEATWRARWRSRTGVPTSGTTATRSSPSIWPPVRRTGSTPAGIIPSSAHPRSPRITWSSGAATSTCTV